jgi:hypothetical protein
MQTDRPGSSSEEFSVRLSWPTAGGGSRQVAAPDRPQSPAPPAEGGQQPAPEAPPGPAPEPVAPTPAPLPARPAPVTEVLAPGVEGSRMSRAFVEAFDRLSDRLLDRIRSLRQDVDADLASVRSELAGLRQAVDEAGDRAPLRQLKASLDEVREDVLALRRAVLEWPALDQVAGDVAAIRGDLAFLFDMTEDGEPAAAPSHVLGQLRAVVDNLAEEVTRLAEQAHVGALGPVLEEVASVRSELTSIRRRLVLRASPIDDEQLERIVDAVAARVVEELRSGDSRRPKRR